jgi:hypothetical protein
MLALKFSFELSELLARLGSLRKENSGDGKLVDSGEG